MSKIIVLAGNPQAAELSDFKELLWQKVKVRKSLDEICHTVELELPDSERSKVKRHDKIEVRVFNPNYTASSQRPRLTTVFVDEITDTIKPGQKRITVIGRSPARDIIDSTWSETILGSSSLEDITKKIADKFKFADKFKIALKKYPEDLETKPIDSFSFENESPWTKLLSEANNQGLIFTSNESGGLYFWKVAKSIRREGFFLEEGKNIKNIQITENGAGQFHTYIVKGGGAQEEAIDETCKNNRVLTINLTGLVIAKEVLKRRALTEMRRRQEVRTVVTVSGWGLSDPQLQRLGSTDGIEVFWNPNFLIPIKIPSSNLNDNYLISQVEYNADQSSYSCDITLVKPEVYG